MGRNRMTETSSKLLLAGRELDALIATRVMGWLAVGRGLDGQNNALPDDWGRPDMQHGFKPIPPYSTSIVAAWELPNIRVLYAPGKYSNHGHHPTLWHGFYATKDSFGEELWFDSYGETAPLAICRAALKTVT
jgi:hypothetical protein